MKPENFMLEGLPPDVKLIDMALRRWTIPVATSTARAAQRRRSRRGADRGLGHWYTIGRTLAVLLMEFRFQSVYEFDLPPPVEQEVLAHHDSLYRSAQGHAAQSEFAFSVGRRNGRSTRRRVGEVVAGTSPPKPVESTLLPG